MYQVHNYGLNSGIPIARQEEHDSCLPEGYNLMNLWFITVLFKHGCAHELPENIFKMYGIQSDSVFMTSYQAMLMLLDYWPHFEKQRSNRNDRVHLNSLLQFIA